MKLPKFLLADNSDFPEDLFVVHTEYPRFILNVEEEEVEWLDDLEVMTRKLWPMKPPKWLKQPSNGAMTNSLNMTKKTTNNKETKKGTQSGSFFLLLF